VYNLETYLRENLIRSEAMKKLSESKCPHSEMCGFWDGFNTAIETTLALYEEEKKIGFLANHISDKEAKG